VLLLEGIEPERTDCAVTRAASGDKVIEGVWATMIPRDDVIYRIGLGSTIDTRVAIPSKHFV
jgi:hypothetical protein